ncbi:M23 family metallopeptidase [Stenotrophomonas sp. MMGLT7]|uniref:M23 family metallopeptidase n=1 Tax=Stenotrophomonas sp. MMGLT7 TaxID=2901227 RepID=UPI001E38A1D1|nr:M23 family metallopeptidase [Stenotrophomonas sp. MMGLT7]MCD7099336.1 M23 family metallopeptidase [Stenotrophomonas sp. MMGLT7]
MTQPNGPSDSPATPSLARRLRQALVRLLVLAVLAVAAAWAWKQPWLDRPRMMWTLWRSPPPAALAMPVQGVQAGRVADTFGAPRGSDRQHAGVDIFAPRGTAVVAATSGIVSSIREGGLGGRQVWVLGPALERHYYAHLDDWAPELRVGQVVNPGDRLGSVGDTGNAKGTPPHLHYGIYGSQGAYDPLPLLRNSR